MEGPAYKGTFTSKTSEMPDIINKAGKAAEPFIKAAAKKQKVIPLKQAQTAQSKHYKKLDEAIKREKFMDDFHKSTSEHEFLVKKERLQGTEPVGPWGPKGKPYSKVKPSQTPYKPTKSYLTTESPPTMENVRLPKVKPGTQGRGFGQGIIQKGHTPPPIQSADPGINLMTRAMQRFGKLTHGERFRFNIKRHEDLYDIWESHYTSGRMDRLHPDVAKLFREMYKTKP